MADNRAWTAGRYAVRSLEEIVPFFEYGGRNHPVEVRVDAGANMIVLTAGQHEIFLTIKRGKLFEAHQLIGAVSTQCGTGFSPSTSLLRALIDLVDPMM
jgi:hypothetical protein